MKTQKIIFESDVSSQTYSSKDGYIYWFGLFVVLWFVGGAVYSHYFLTPITMKPSVIKNSGNLQKSLKNQV